MDALQLSGCVSIGLGALLLRLWQEPYLSAITRLKTFHEETWRELGAPEERRVGLVFASSNMMWFVLSRQHRSLGDKKLSLQCDLVLVSLVLVPIVMLVGFFLLFPLGIVLKGISAGPHA